MPYYDLFGNYVEGNLLDLDQIRRQGNTPQPIPLDELDLPDVDPVPLPSADGTAVTPEIIDMIEQIGSDFLNWTPEQIENFISTVPAQEALQLLNAEVLALFGIEESQAVDIQNLGLIEIDRQRAVSTALRNQYTDNRQIGLNAGLRNANNSGFYQQQLQERANSAADQIGTLTSAARRDQQQILSGLGNTALDEALAEATVLNDYAQVLSEFGLDFRTVN